MQHRYDNTNIPTEVLRTFVVVVEAGNFSQAGNVLGLTQSAISAQIRRLEQVVGREVFRRSAAGMHLTEHGKVVLSYARRILTMNDQLLSHSKPNHTPHQIRIGLARWLPDNMLTDVVRKCSSIQGRDKVSFRCDNLEHLMRDLISGQLDLALLCNVPDPHGIMVREWWEDMYWVKSPELTLSPDAPIPLVSWPGSQSDRLAAKAFAEVGLQCEISFSAPDIAGRLAAAAAGLGVLVVAERHITRDVQIATESFLPPLPPTRKGIYAREGLELESVEPVAAVMEACIRVMPANVLTANIRKALPDNRVIRPRKVQRR
jgi:DNA-binding transcriptional LysR family regulator